MGPWGTAPKRQEDLSGTDMYHCAKFHADWWHHCIDIETYKIQHGKEHIDHRQLFKLVSNGHELRGHDLKLYKQYNRLNIRKHFFSQWVTDAWNQLPPSVVDATSISSFKRNLEDFRKDMGTNKLASQPIIIQASTFKIPGTDVAWISRIKFYSLTHSFKGQQWQPDALRMNVLCYHKFSPTTQIPWFFCISLTFPWPFF